MFLDLNDPRLGNSASLVFRSFWPSNDSLLDGKVAEILSSNLGQDSIVQSAMASNWDALRIAVRNKATVLGDVLSSQLPKIAAVSKGPYGEAISGIFAAVEWGTVRKDPEQALTAMARVGVPAALTALTSIPIAGQLAAAYFAIGLKLAEIASKPNPLIMPWSEYSRDTDEDLTSKVVLDVYSKAVDQTNLFRPPWDPQAPWRMGMAGDAKKPKGYVWAPWTGGAIPWRSDGVGSIPGTMRIFGQVQLTSSRKRPDELDRYVRFAKGFTPKEILLRWPGTKTNCGDFYPSAAQACGMLGSMAGSPGSPDNYKVHTATLAEEWSRAFESMEASFAELWNNPGVLLKDLSVPFVALARQILSDAQSVWVAFRSNDASPWSFGVPFEIPSFWGLIVPGIYSGGLPGDPAGRTPALWIEEDTARDPKAIGWPYGGLPRQHKCARYKECSSDLAAVVDPEAVRSPARWKGDEVPSGYRSVAWPPAEADAAQYGSPWEKIIKPTLERQRLQQERGLKASLVCAYVRPVEVAGLPAYGAFRDPALRKLCLEVREILLTHPKRFAVSLRDVEAVDPAFAVRLKNSGVTGSFQDFQKSLDVAAAPLIAGAEPPPENREPQGGIPFESDVRALLGNPRNLAKVAGILGGSALAILGGYYALQWASRRK